MQASVLIIDDEVKIRELLAKIIQLEGFDVQTAVDAKSGLKKLQQQAFDVVLSDIKLPDANGLDLLPEIKKLQPTAEVILLTAYGTIPDSVTAIKLGAFDYLTKGDDNNRIIPLLYKAVDKAALNNRLARLEAQVQKKYSFESIIGESKLIKDAVNAASKVAATDATVLLAGETGTGKEVFAQAIHQNSGRSKAPFIAINCAAFSKELLENELFGHKAGAFTGAVKDSKGIFEEANGGTVFLDEIGEMALDLQAKLLRVLETGSFLKVGDSKPTQVDVRIVAATNRNLKAEIEAKNFREDLYYRISTFTIELPALNERRSDIPLLTDFFIVQLSKKINRRITGVEAAYSEALQKHHWKGNIRELKNVLERSVILSDDGVLSAATLPADFLGQALQSGSAATDTLATVEKAHIQRVLKYTEGNKAEAAKILDIGLTTLYRKIDEYKIG
ncbi:MAG: sigma-54 dependent transcriptional regulator [Chitinophagaceae bacterium]|uniref:sigma-54-dependent transcriptional regulator n=1 Tax=unclassified Paraflavitalea TaxID=2798305 RepID=UPI003D355112|nr:sigma-54 dependent transcriptional regulator [Chitinophagaceae bacterium]